MVSHIRALLPTNFSYIFMHTDITGSPCGISAATPMAPVQNDNSQPIAVDIYLAEYTERMPELYLQPGWIASLNLPHNKTITYGDLKSLIYDSTELEVRSDNTCTGKAFVYTPQCPTSKVDHNTVRISTLAGLSKFDYQV